jgi:hypothetical protein
MGKHRTLSLEDAAQPGDELGPYSHQELQVMHPIPIEARGAFTLP